MDEGGDLFKRTFAEAKTWQKEMEEGRVRQMRSLFLQSMTRHQPEHLHPPRHHYSWAHWTPLFQPPLLHLLHN